MRDKLYYEVIINLLHMITLKVELSEVKQINDSIIELIDESVQFDCTITAYNLLYKIFLTYLKCCFVYIHIFDIIR